MRVIFSSPSANLAEVEEEEATSLAQAMLEWANETRHNFVPFLSSDQWILMNSRESFYTFHLVKISAKLFVDAWLQVAAGKSSLMGISHHSSLFPNVCTALDGEEVVLETTMQRGYLRLASMGCSPLSQLALTNFRIIFAAFKDKRLDASLWTDSDVLREVLDEDPSDDDEDDDDDDDEEEDSQAQKNMSEEGTGPVSPKESDNAAASVHGPPQFITASPLPEVHAYSSRTRAAEGADGSATSS